MEKKFVRRDAKRYSKLGKKRKKLLKWRRPKGRDNKMREKRTGYPVGIRIGFKSPKKDSEDEITRIENMKDLESVGKRKAIISGKVGAKKRIEIIKKANEMKLRILNLKGDKNAVK